MKKILLGNDAIVQGALEAGVDFVSVYPGTPSSEIGNTFYKIAKDHNIYFEFSTNEKVALEAAIGASYSGLKCLVAMKSFGLNVASDALMPFCYTGTKGPVVIIVADDPGCFSSGQSEQDSRGYAYLAHIPMLEPSDAQEAKDFTKLGFEISEKFKIPVIVRTTTRIAHQRMPVEIGKIKKSKTTGRFVKNVKQFVTMPPRVLEMKKELLEKIEKVREYAEKSKINKIDRDRVSAKLGIITSAISYLYAKELYPDVPILKLGFFYPLPKKKIKNFIKGLDKVLVIEQSEPYLEKEIKLLAGQVEVIGDRPGAVQGQSLNLPKRFPKLCPACSYNFVFSAVKKAAPKNTIFGGDIGCYMLAGFPPHNIQDYLLCMGASIGVAHGIKKSSNQKLIAFIGDSTFFHAGIPALINTVFNKSNPLIIIMDNQITAMTGHQPNPGQEIKIENIVKACGIKNVKVIDPINIKKFQAAIKEFLSKRDASVIVARRMCAYWARKKYGKK